MSLFEVSHVRLSPLCVNFSLPFVFVISFNVELSLTLSTCPEFLSQSDTMTSVTPPFASKVAYTVSSLLTVLFFFDEAKLAVCSTTLLLAAIACTLLSYRYVCVAYSIFPTTSPATNKLLIPVITTRFFPLICRIMLLLICCLHFPASRYHSFQNV